MQTVEGTPFVRKYSPHKEYNSRLIHQVNLQKKAGLARSAPFRVPNILATGFESGLYWFDSEYVKFGDAVFFLNNSDSLAILSFAERLNEVIFYFYQSRSISRRSIFWSINTKLKALSVGGSPRNSRAIEKLILYFRRIEDVDRYEASICHGDLTLENVLVGQDGGLNLIDFLDINHEHYWFSISKIFQDLEFRWTKIRRPHDPLSAVTCKILSNKIFDFVHAMDPDYSLVHYPLQALNFLRIVPYAENETYEFRRAIWKNIDFCIERLDGV